jgi:hypothetical protein
MSSYFRRNSFWLVEIKNFQFENKQGRIFKKALQKNTYHQFEQTGKAATTFWLTSLKLNILTTIAAKSFARAL